MVHDRHVSYYWQLAIDKAMIDTTNWETSIWGTKQEDQVASEHWAARSVDYANNAIPPINRRLIEFNSSYESEQSSS